MHGSVLSGHRQSVEPARQSSTSAATDNLPPRSKQNAISRVKCSTNWMSTQAHKRLLCWVTVCSAEQAVAMKGGAYQQLAVLTIGQEHTVDVDTGS